MRRTIVSILTLGVTLGTLAACGSDDEGSDPVAGSEPSSDEYCALAEEVGSVVDDASPGSASEKILQALQAVEAAAPDDIKAEWTTYADAFGDFLKAQKIMKNPNRVDEGNDLMQTAATEMSPAAKAVGKHVRDNCDV